MRGGMSALLPALGQAVIAVLLLGEHCHRACGPGQRRHAAHRQSEQQAEEQRPLEPGGGRGGSYGAAAAGAAAG